MQQEINKFKMLGYTIFRDIELELFWSSKTNKEKNYNEDGERIFRPVSVCFDYICLKQGVGIRYQLEIFPLLV